MGVDVTIVHKVLSATVLEIERNQTRIANPGLKDDPEALQEEMENNCLTSLYLVMILTKVCKFPCASTSKLLLQAGADPQATDQTKNTPLHVIVSYKKIVSDFLTLHAIIMALLEAGAHIDAVNAAGQTPLSAAATGVAEIILKSQSKMSLKCLAAQSIRKYNLNYQGQVPLSLESFIQIHGP